MSEPTPQGRSLQEFRRSLGMSPGAFARALDLHPERGRQRVHEWEIDKRPVPTLLCVVMELAAAVPGVRGWLQQRGKADDPTGRGADRV